MGNVQMEADQIRYKDSSGTYRNVQTGLAAAIAGGGGGSSTLAGLTDTDITTPSDGQVLTYDSTAEKWKNAAIPAQSIDGLSDTAISTPAAGQVLTYDSTAEKWGNASIPAQSITGLSDTTISTPTDGQVLTYDGTSSKWVNGGIASLTPADIISSLNTGFSYDADNYCIQKIGKALHVKLHIISEDVLTLNQQVNVGVLNSAYYPKRAMVSGAFSGISKWDTAGAGYCYIGTTGNITITSYKSDSKAILIDTKFDIA